MIVAEMLVRSGISDVFGSGSPSLRIITRFWQLTHQRSPLLSLNIGEEHAGQACFVRVDPCRSKSAIILMLLDSLSMLTPLFSKFSDKNMFLLG